MPSFRGKKNANEMIWKTNQALNLKAPKPLAEVKKMPEEGRSKGTWGGGVSRP